ncbi:ABC transporter F family member 4-like [Dorcoceras hygrometricum]|uniref:ABC transporter F family member 4-like n=1 Tax=Dorcoceras hygrometricum TaxID=472368 RepID=A0A2Z7A619_9LAMI|nr:ABC transporter F family member 4-like [Dorcoceras hygrometricum]
MGRKKPDEGGANTKAKPSGKERLSVSAMLATMDSYTDDIDLPSSKVEDDEEQLELNETNKLPSRQTRSSTKHLDIVVSEK